MKYLITLFFSILFFLPQLQAEISVGLADSITCVCPGNPQQAFEVTATGTAGPFTFEWSGPEGYTSTEMMPSDIEISGTYTLMVTNAYECTFEYDIEVPACEGPTFTFQTSPPRFCDTEGMEIGTINLSLNVDESLFSIEWYKDGEEIVGEIDFMIEGLGAGNYHAVVIDGEGCRFTSEVVTLEETEEINVTATATPSCLLEETGIIDITVTGDEPFGFEWSNGANTEDLNNVGVGVYSLTVTDASGCVAELADIAEITPALAHPEITLTTQPPTCFGANDGSITLTFDPPGGFLVQWNTGQSGNSIQNLDAGLYIATITDTETNCSLGTQTIDLPGSQQAMLLDSEIVNPTCETSEDGGIWIFVSGGTAPYQYQIDGGDPETDDAIWLASGLAAGTYVVTVTDALGCEESLQLTIESGDDFNLEFSATEVSCQNGTPDGSLTILASGGGAGPYNYTWTKEGDPGFLAHTTTISNLDIGTYCVTVESTESGCTSSDCYTLEGAEYPYIERVTIKATGPGYNALIYNAHWEMAANNCVVLQGGNTADFTDQVLDDMENGLVELEITAITNVPATISNLLLQESGVLILNGMVLENTTAFTVASSSVQQMISNNSISQTLQFEGADSHGNPILDLSSGQNGQNCVPIPLLSENCDWLPVPTIMQNGGNGQDVVHVLEKSCFTVQLEANIADKQINITTITGAQPTVTIVWEDLEAIAPDAIVTNGGMTVSNLIPGFEYCVTVRDGSHCEVEECIYLCKQLSETAYDISMIPPCPDDPNSGMICVDLADGLAIDFGLPTSPENCLEDIPAGNYNMTLTDLVCEQELEIEVSLDQASTPLSIGFSDVLSSCPGQNDGTATATANGGRPPYTYIWENGDTDAQITGLSEGICYSVTVTDACGSFTSDCIKLPNYEAISIPDGVTVDKPCFNSFNGTINGDFVGGIPPYVIILIGPTNDDVVTINNGAATSFSIDNITEGTYTLKIFDDCSQATPYEESIQIDGEDPEIIETMLLPECMGQADGGIEIMVSDSPDNMVTDIEWSTGEEDVTSIEGLASGHYEVTVTLEDGCNMNRAYDLVNFSPEVTLEIVNTCAGQNAGAITLTFEDDTDSEQNQPYHAIWNNGTTWSFTESMHSQTLTGLGPASYIVTVTNEWGCEIEKTAEVLSSPIPICELVDYQAELIIDGSPASNGFLEIDVPFYNEEDYVISWSNGGFTKKITSLSSGDYEVTITDIHTGCFYTTSYFVPLCPLTFGGSSILISSSSLTPALSNNGGAIDITVVGGEAPYTYKWAGPNQFSSESEDITGLDAGTYCVVIHDDCGRRLEKCYEIVDNCPDYSLDMKVHNQCEGSPRQIELENVDYASGDEVFEVILNHPAMENPIIHYNYTNTGEDLFIDLPADIYGTFTIEVIDEDGCSMIGYAEFLDGSYSYYATRNRKVGDPGDPDELGEDFPYGDIRPEDFIQNAMIIPSLNDIDGQDVLTAEELVDISFIAGLCLEQGCGCYYDGTNTICNTGATSCEGFFCFEPENSDISDIALCNAKGKIRAPGVGYFDVPAGWGTKIEIEGEPCGCVFPMGAFVQGGSPNAYNELTHTFGPIHYSSTQMIWAECSADCADVAPDGTDQGNDIEECVYYDGISHDCYLVTYVSASSEDGSVVGVCNILSFEFLDENCGSNEYSYDLCEDESCIYDNIKPFWCMNEEYGVCVTGFFWDPSGTGILTDEENILYQELHEDDGVCTELMAEGVYESTVICPGCIIDEDNISLPFGDAEGNPCETILMCGTENAITIQGTLIYEYSTGNSGLYDCMDYCHDGNYCLKITKCDLGEYGIVEESRSIQTAVVKDPELDLCSIDGVVHPNSCYLYYYCGITGNPGPGDTPFHTYCHPDCSNPDWENDYPCNSTDLTGCGGIDPIAVVSENFIDEHGNEKEIYRFEIVQEGEFIVSEVFPNPFQNELNIKLTSSHEGTVQMRLVNLYGQIIIQTEESIIRGKNPIIFDVQGQGLENGLYHLMITDNKGNAHIEKVVFNR